MVLFLSAGSETTSILLTAFIYLVSTNAGVYRRLTSEIRTAFSSTQDITLDSVMALDYLGASINETLRLFPPGAVNQQRTVPPGGANIAGKHVPAGTTVSTAPWAISRSSAHFHKPDEFLPERWLPEKAAEFANDKLNASQPFGVGPKSCLGKNLSFFESRLIIAHLLFNFDVRLVDEGGLAKENRKWNLDPKMRSIKLYQALAKPNLWVRWKEVDHN